MTRLLPEDILRDAVDAFGSGIYSTALHALPPGNYRFFYLPDTGWLLSAEGIEPPAVQPAQASPEGSDRKQRGVRRD